MLDPNEIQQFYSIEKQNKINFVYINNQEGTYYIITEEKDPDLYLFFMNIYCHRFTEKEFEEQVKEYYKEVNKFEDLAPSENIWKDEEWNKFIRYKEELCNKRKIIFVNY